MKRASRGRQRLLAALLGSFAAGVAADLGARAALGTTRCYRAHERFEERWPSCPTLERYRADVRWRGTSWGDLAAMSGEPAWREPREETFETDARGYRNDAAWLSEACDVLLLGDSFAAGIGSKQDEMLASALRREHGLRAYSLAWPGSPWKHHLRLVAHGAEIAKSDRAALVMMWFSGNDLDDPNEGEWVPAWNGFAARQAVRVETFLTRSPLLRLARPGAGADRERVIARELEGRTMLFYAPYDRARRRSAAEVASHPNAPRLLDALSRTSALARELGLRPLLVIAPCKEEVLAWVLDGGAPWSTPPAPSAFSRWACEAATARGVPSLDLTAPLIEETQCARRPLWWVDDTHWDPEGQRFAAGRIVAEVARQEPGRQRARPLGLDRQGR